MSNGKPTITTIEPTPQPPFAGQPGVFDQPAVVPEVPPTVIDVPDTPATPLQAPVDVPDIPAGGARDLGLPETLIPLPETIAPPPGMEVMELGPVITVDPDAFGGSLETGLIEPQLVGDAPYIGTDPDLFPTHNVATGIDPATGNVPSDDVFGDDFLFGLGGVLNDGIDEIFSFFDETEDSSLAREAKEDLISEWRDGNIDTSDLAEGMKALWYNDQLNKGQGGFSLNPKNWGTMEWTIASMLMQVWMNKESMKFQQKMTIEAEERAEERALRMLAAQTAARKEIMGAEGGKGGGAVSAPGGGGLVA